MVMGFGPEQEDGSLFIFMASYLKQVEEYVPQPVDWTLCFLLMT